MNYSIDWDGPGEQDENIDYASFGSALLTLLDRIYLETDDETTRSLCKQRFQILEDHGFTVEFGEPASGVVQ